MAFALERQPQLVIALVLQIQAALLDAALLTIGDAYADALRLLTGVEYRVIVHITHRFVVGILRLPGQDYADAGMHIVQAFAGRGVHPVVAGEFAVAQHLGPEAAINPLPDMLQIGAVEMVVRRADDLVRLNGKGRFFAHALAPVIWRRAPA